jgi:hypothetical protein
VCPIGCPDDRLLGRQSHHDANRVRSCDGWSLHVGNPSAAHAQQVASLGRAIRHLPPNAIAIASRKEGRLEFHSALLESGYDIPTIPEPLGNRDVSTTTIYTHVLSRSVRGVRSPLDDP